MSEPERILIIRLSSLGDILHALPACQAVRHARPQARIDWLVEKSNAFLLSAVGGIDEVVSIDMRTLRRAPWNPGAWRSLVSSLAALRAKKYDLALDFQGLVKTGLLAWCSGARLRFGFSRQYVRERAAALFYNRPFAPPRGSMHVIEMNLMLARAAGVARAAAAVEFRENPEDARAVAALLEKEKLSVFAVINPGGGWPTKRWPPARYAALADRMGRELQLRVAVTTGPGEAAIYDEIAGHCTGPPPAHLQVPFLQLIPLFARARLVIGGDTGPFHLACALGRPVVGIFGPTSPERNGPYGNPARVVCRRLHCSFCYGRSCPTRNECMEIGVDEVFEAVRQCLDETQ